jgi:putative membrane protein
MRILTWAIRVALFVLLLAFAAKNTDPVTLRFYFGLEWRWPLVALLLAFFAAGVALGLTAMFGTWLAQRRQLSRLERTVEARESRTELTRQPPAAEG